MERMMDDINNHKDVMHSTKHTYVDYDIILANMVSTTIIIFINPKLGQQLLSAESIMMTAKKT